MVTVHMSENKQLKMPIKRICGFVDAIPLHLSNIEQKDQLKILDIVYSQFPKMPEEIFK